MLVPPRDFRFQVYTVYEEEWMAASYFLGSRLQFSQFEHFARFHSQLQLLRNQTLSSR